MDKRSLVGYCPQGGQESDTTERLLLTLNLWNTKYLGEEVFKEHISQVILVDGAWLKAG